MLKRLIELAIAAAIIYAGYHAAVVYLHHYQFEDALKETARFGYGRTEDQLKERVIHLADEYDIPLKPEAIVIRTDRNGTRIMAPYTARVKLLPNYIYEMKLEPVGDSWHQLP